MKITLATVQAPFVRGGAEYLVDGLAARLRGRGHRVDVAAVPFKWYPPQAVVEHMTACRLLRLTAGDPDLVIALKFPAYLAPCANKRVWLLHQFRQAYELWATPHAGMPDDPEGRAVRRMVHNADAEHLGRAGRLFTNSRIVADRLARFNGLEADGVLYPPLDRPELFGPGEHGGYFFYPSRLNTIKRQHVAVEAMRYVRSDFGLVLAGRADADAYQRHLEECVDRWGLRGRVKFLGRISEEEKARWMAGAYAALYLPHDEDSYGYVTLEAFHSAKAVLTFRDSGGVHELVEDEVNGLVLEPTAEALAAGLEALWADPARARELGGAARAALRDKGIDWEYVLDRLLD